jgi:hypothetical protein
MLAATTIGIEANISPASSFKARPGRSALQAEGVEGARVFAGKLGLSVLGKTSVKL